MTKRMKEEIENFKSKNGNNTYTTKDLLMYIVQRVDSLPCEEHLNKISNVELVSKTDIQEVKTLIKQWRWFAGILLTVVLAVIGLSTQV